MCIRDRDCRPDRARGPIAVLRRVSRLGHRRRDDSRPLARRLVRQGRNPGDDVEPVSYTHLRAHETVLDLVCRLLLEKKK